MITCRACGHQVAHVGALVAHQRGGACKAVQRAQRLLDDGWEPALDLAVGVQALQLPWRSVRQLVTDRSRTSVRKRVEPRIWAPRWALDVVRALNTQPLRSSERVRLASEAMVAHKAGVDPVGRVTLELLAAASASEPRR